MKSEIKKYIEFIKRWEGGLSRDTSDSAASYPCPVAYNGKNGYHTNVGITWKVFSSFYGPASANRFFKMDAEDWFNVFKTLYWNTVRADEFNHISIGIFVTGMAWGSGKKQAIKSLQQAIINCGVSVVKDGILGNKTMTAANSIDPQKLFDALTNERERFFKAIAKPGSKNAKFLKGWLRRLEDYRSTFRP